MVQVRQQPTASSCSTPTQPGHPVGRRLPAARLPIPQPRRPRLCLVQSTTQLVSHRRVFAAAEPNTHWLRPGTGVAVWSEATPPGVAELSGGNVTGCGL